MEQDAELSKNNLASTQQELMKLQENASRLADEKSSLEDELKFIFSC